MPLTPGEHVTIYQDPFSREKPEGLAILVSKESTGPDGEEQWLVRFPGEKETFSRCIYDK